MAEFFLIFDFLNLTPGKTPAPLPPQYLIIDAYPILACATLCLIYSFLSISAVARIQFLNSVSPAHPTSKLAKNSSL